MDLHQKPSGITCDFKISITFPEFTRVYYDLLQFSMVYWGLSSLIHNHQLSKKTGFSPCDETCVSSPNFSPRPPCWKPMRLWRSSTTARPIWSQHPGSRSCCGGALQMLRPCGCWKASWWDAKNCGGEKQHERKKVGIMWVNYNDITVRPSPGNYGLCKGNHPQMTSFRFLNYYNLPRIMIQDGTSMYNASW